MPPLTLVGLDWGSSNLRAFAFDADGSVISTRSSPHGAMTLSDANAFEHAFAEIAGDWLAASPQAMCLASGMVGARGAWIEAGYVDVNSDARELSGHVVRIRTRLGRDLFVVPGVKSAEPDVMRGEETQIVGADLDNGTIVLPGTHSKWACVKNGRIAAFRTALTGEMNALLREHSTVGKILSTPPMLEHRDAIARGVMRAQTNVDWLHQLFLFRSQVVTNAQNAAHVSSELSAWLIASEIAQMRAVGFDDTDLYLVASDSLAEWYQTVAAAFGMKCLVQSGAQCAARGLWRIARAVV
jgi:2-dehydro-3-deoxygalactonokinase